jgi:hypothetical protein
MNRPPLGSLGEANLVAGERLWPHSNKDLVPASEQRISIYVVRNLSLASLTPGAG